MAERMTKAETFEYIEELETNVKELNEELRGRPERLVVQINEITIENSAIGGENLGALFGALAICQGEFESVKKGSSAHSYDYADIKAVIGATKDITSKNGISVTQMNVSKMLGKTPLVGVKTILGHEGGGWVSSEVYIPVMKTKMNTFMDF